MPFLTVRGLGALPNVPTKQGELLPNRQWVRYYEVDTQHQLKQCPKNAPFGCWIEDGYAWGQREWYPEEFTPKGFVLKPLPAPFPHPSVPTTTAPKAKHKHHAKKKAAPPAPAYQQPFLSPLPTPTPPTSPAYTIVTQPPEAPTPPLAVPPDHARAGVGAVVGIGLFIAIGLTLLR